MSTPSVFATSQNVTIPVVPELYNAGFLDILLPAFQNVKQGSAVDQHNPRNPMIEVLKATAHRTLTDNLSPSFASTGSACLDAFLELKPLSRRDQLDDWLARSWNEDPELTLRMIWNTRSIHDGKGDRETFYRAFGWLYENHPRTAIQNLPHLVNACCDIKKKTKAPHGYWKDLLNIVALAAVGELTNRSLDQGIFTFLHNYIPHTRQWGQCKEKERLTPEQLAQRQKDQQAKSRAERVAKHIHFHEQLVSRLPDPKFRALYIMVARLFAEKLAEDIACLDRVEALPHGGERKTLVHQISLAGKWAPSPGGSHDRVPNLGTAIALLLHHSHSLGPTLPQSTHESPLSTPDAHVLRSLYSH